MATKSPLQPANGTRSAEDTVQLVQPIGAGGTVGTPVSQPTATSGAPTQVASSATSVTLKALNTSRKGLWIFNDSTQILHVKLGTTASATDKNVEIAAGGHWEMPTSPVYTGRVDGLWDSANGNAYVTELT